jgi:16S rRNA (cytidine1402-2'-O)-methyltransferase
MAEVFLIPAQLSDDGFRAVHPYTIPAVQQCQVFFCENQRSTRRFFKSLWKTYQPGETIHIDNYEWHDLDEKQTSLDLFRELLRQNKNIGIVSEAGCPGVADPGQFYVAIAQEMRIKVNPLVGPSSILLALMASGMNGQHFEFHGYLPIDKHQRDQSIKELENLSRKKNCTQIFIETPYRNNQMLQAVLNNCQSSTRVCIAINITGNKESILTKRVDEWKKDTPDLNKIPVIFLIHCG